MDTDLTHGDSCHGTLCLDAVVDRHEAWLCGCEPGDTRSLADDTRLICEAGNKLCNYIPTC